MATDVVNDPERSLYRLSVDGEPAGVIEYRREDGAIDILHTIVSPAFKGRGLGGVLVQAALDDIREHSTDRLVVHCSYALGWLEKHPEYQDLTER